MSWYHLIDQSGNHWVLTPDAPFYFYSQAVDGSEPIFLIWPAFNMRWIITAADFNLIVTSLPAGYNVVAATN